MLFCVGATAGALVGGGGHAAVRWGRLVDAGTRLKDAWSKAPACAA